MSVTDKLISSVLVSGGCWKSVCSRPSRCCADPSSCIQPKIDGFFLGPFPILSANFIQIHQVEFWVILQPWTTRPSGNVECLCHWGKVSEHKHLSLSSKNTLFVGFHFGEYKTYLFYSIFKVAKSAKLYTVVYWYWFFSPIIVSSNNLPKHLKLFQTKLQRRELRVVYGWMIKNDSRRK